MNKKLIRLTESDLHRIVKESVNRMLNENESDLSDLDGYNVGIKTFSDLNDKDRSTTLEKIIDSELSLCMNKLKERLMIALS